MQEAAVVLEVLRERGRKGLPLSELYRQMFNPAMYLLAYGRIYSNQGAMTPGACGETADGMSEAMIGEIIELMRFERYRFAPARRVYIPKKNGTLRPLGIPSWRDKLTGEVVRLILEAVYEPVFSSRSHGFRKGRGCHTALRQVRDAWTGTVWFIEGDISDCYGSVDHEILMRILAEKIEDQRFLRLIRGMLRAGYLEDWEFRDTLSGTPQGGGATRGRTCMSGPHRWRSVMLAEVWSQASARGPVLALTCVAGNGGVRSSGESRRLLVHPGEYGREEDRTGEPREPSLMPRDCGPLPGGCGWQGFRAGRCEAAGAGRDIPFRPGGHHRPGVKKAPSPIGTHACGTWKPRRGPAVTAGRPTVREAEAPGGTGWPKKLMPVAERQQETGTTWLAPSLAVPDNWPDTGCCPDLKGC